MPRKVKADAPNPAGNHDPIMSESGRFLPSLPTTGDDLMGQWSLPKSAWEIAKIKISRMIPGTSRPTICGEVPLQDYRLDTVAANFGPGIYQLVLSKNADGLWNAHTARVDISPEYADANGFTMTPPPPRPAPFQVRDIRTYSDVAARTEQGQISPQDIAAMVETIVERTMARMITPPAPPHNGLQEALSLMSILEKREDEKIERALKLAGFANPRQPEESGWAGVVREALPTLAQVLGDVVMAFRPNVQSAPDALTYEPEPEPEPAPMEPPVSINLTPEQQRILAPAVAMLGSFKELLVRTFAGPHPPEAIAKDLGKWIPGPMKPALQCLSGLIDAQGPQVLSMIDPRLATEKAAAVVKLLAV